MNTIGTGGKRCGWFLLLAGLVLSLGALSEARAAILATLEGPTDGQPVAGVNLIRGWAFSDTAGVQISQVTLLVDGTTVTAIPCCSERGDVAAAFPGNPNARTSGFGLTQNYNLIGAGTHTIAVQICDSSGAQVTRSSTVTVIKPGNFEFLDLVDLSMASLQRQGQDLVVSGVRIRNKQSQQAVRITARLRWFSNL